MGRDMERRLRANPQCSKLAWVLLSPALIWLVQRLAAMSACVLQPNLINSSKDAPANPSFTQ